MNCLTSEQLVDIALAGSDVSMAYPSQAHLSACSACQARLTTLKEQLNTVAQAMAWFDRDHAVQRERLLASLASAKDQPAPAQNCIPQPRIIVPIGPNPRAAFKRTFTHNLKEVLTMPRTWIGSAVAAALILGVFFLSHGPGSQALMAQTAQALRDVKSYQCRLTTTMVSPDGAKHIDVAKIYWLAPDSYRIDGLGKEKIERSELHPKGKPGLDIDYRHETFMHLEPMKGAVSPIFVLSKLAGFAGQADRQLEARDINGMRAPGFQIAIAKIDPSLGDGELSVWIDPKTKLPVRVEGTKEGSIMVLEDFQWNVPTDTWFTVEPPAGYQDKTPTPPGVEEITKDIIVGFKTFAKYCGGKYPQTKMIYGDVTSEELNRNAGLPLRSPPTDKALDKVYWECIKAYAGFGQINVLQRHDTGAIYHGKSVGPADTNKVLFRWTLTDGRFRVIYGDLHVEDVSAAKLKVLEAK
jgi:outer membrane lipoprotein-sorting protein